MYSRLLLELNPEVTGDCVDESVEQVLSNRPDFFFNFDLVIVTEISEKTLITLSNLLWNETGIVFPWAALQGRRKMPPAWKRWAGLRSFWCITSGTSSARKHRPAKTTFTFFNLVGIKLIFGMVQSLYEQESRRPWGPAGKMNWPSFSEPEMFAGQKRSKNKELATEILLCLHTPGTLG